VGDEIGGLDDVVRAMQPQPLPVVLTRQGADTPLWAVVGVHWSMASPSYRAGLLGCLRVRGGDIDVASHQLLVRRGKGNHDRHTMLPASAKVQLTAHLKHVCQQYQHDLARSLGTVSGPDAPQRKYPHTARAGGWQWVFPA
jgi:hypothetical protein